MNRYVEEGQFNSSSGNDLAKLYGKQPQLIPVEDFSQADRERVLELLLSQERVVSLLYAKTFPINTTSNKSQGLDGNNQNNNIPELSQLLDGDRPSSPMDNLPTTTSSSAAGVLGGGRPMSTGTTPSTNNSKIPNLPSVNPPRMASR
jgi:hypothetical protein